MIKEIFKGAFINLAIILLTILGLFLIAFALIKFVDWSSVIDWIIDKIIYR